MPSDNDSRRPSLPIPKIGLKEIRSVIFEVGYTLEGRFDPEHVDFKGFCFCYHVHTLSRVLAIINAVVQLSFLLLFCTHFKKNIDDAIMVITTICGVISIPTILIAVFWRKYKLILPYLIYAFLFQMYLIGMIIYSSIKVFKPDNRNVLTADQVLQEQLEIMLALISYALTLLMDTWLFFTLYIEYCYLKGYRKNRSQENV